MEINATCLIIVVLVIIVFGFIIYNMDKWQVIGILLTVLTIWTLFLTFAGIDIFGYLWDGLVSSWDAFINWMGEQGLMILGVNP